MNLPPHKNHPIEDLNWRRTRRLLTVLGSYYAIALVISIGMISAFVWLASEVMESEFVRINSGVLLWIHRWATPGLTEAASIVTWFGSVVGITVLGAIIAVLLYRQRRFVDLALLATVLIGAAILVGSLKVIFHQVRPTVFTPYATENSYSFPSGHTLLSFTLWGFLGWWIVSIRPRELWRWAAGAVGLLIAGTVALSRLYLGVHWPTDVFGGMLLGIGWLALCILGQRWLTRHARRERRLQEAARASSPAAN